MGMKEEILRKAIHFLGVLYFPLYSYAGKTVTLGIVAVLVLLSILIEILRRKYRILPEWILNPYEIRGIGAYVYFGIAALLLTAFFSAEAAVVGVLTGCVGDGVSGLVKTYLKNKPRNRWRNAPFISMFLSSFLFITIISTLEIGMEFDLELRVLALACFVGAFMESKPIKVRNFYVNDNLSVPLLSGVFYQLFS
ncbi:MAG: hypothetical protein H0Z28_02535 [Archaeoglobus sp.]|nr:hypothetical protein [Archaeoglobus sp.]